MGDIKPNEQSQGTISMGPSPVKLDIENGGHIIRVGNAKLTMGNLNNSSIKELMIILEYTYNLGFSDASTLLMNKTN
jgi:hypothetical protein